MSDTPHCPVPALSVQGWFILSTIFILASRFSSHPFRDPSTSANLSTFLLCPDENKAFSLWSRTIFNDDAAGNLLMHVNCPLCVTYSVICVSILFQRSSRLPPDSFSFLFSCS
ncbi:hypothetical protein K435DRAFT_385886 [Dendrothele bispora CBS 962.96]|uniref:Uncharacterized protein n=1 Tax=Dendrothele bispora (strain CBS 962.96) TaxID=1314807 RepID=A0A4S8LA24_DENBC|nr:hypothetical protein K435DRAFT_385886 [Dendrothele bispora CBS 962.96]